MRIVVDVARCEGNGQCVIDAPDLFALDDEDNLLVADYEPPPELWPQAEQALSLVDDQPAPAKEDPA
jgi:ferredoxin